MPRRESKEFRCFAKCFELLRVKLRVAAIDVLPAPAAASLALFGRGRMAIFAASQTHWWLERKDATNASIGCFGTRRRGLARRVP